MGEATYYLRAKYQTSTDAKDALENVRFLFDEGATAYEWWQRHRTGETKEQFWSTFRKQFPETTKYLKFCNLFGKDHHNGLAGYLDFGTKDEIKDNLVVVGDEIRYSALVWHFARWEPLCDYLKCFYGAIEAGSNSDEYMDIDPYEQVKLS